jgi:hypothetical protein
MESRAAVHTIATIASLSLAFRMAFGGPIWAAIAWYFGAFVGVHVVMVPIMTAWHAMLERFDRRVRSVVEEELIRFDMHTYQRQLQRVFPPQPKAPEE